MTFFFKIRNTMLPHAFQSRMQNQRHGQIDALNSSKLIWEKIRSTFEFIKRITNVKKWIWNFLCFKYRLKFPVNMEKYIYMYHTVCFHSVQENYRTRESYAWKSTVTIVTISKITSIFKDLLKWISTPRRKARYQSHYHSHLDHLILFTEISSIRFKLAQRCMNKIILKNHFLTKIT